MLRLDGQGWGLAGPAMPSESNEFRNYVADLLRKLERETSPRIDREQVLGIAMLAVARAPRLVREGVDPDARCESCGADSGDGQENAWYTHPESPPVCRRCFTEAAAV